MQPQTWHRFQNLKKKSNFFIDTFLCEHKFFSLILRVEPSHCLMLLALRNFSSAISQYVHPPLTLQPLLSLSIVSRTNESKNADDWLPKCFYQRCERSDKRRRQICNLTQIGPTEWANGYDGMAKGMPVWWCAKYFCIQCGAIHWRKEDSLSEYT